MKLVQGAMKVSVDPEPTSLASAHCDAAIAVAHHSIAIVRNLPIEFVDDPLGGVLIIACERGITEQWAGEII
jgi:hypothetical protein